MRRGNARRSDVELACGSALKNLNVRQTKNGGPGRDRTDDLFHAMEARSQLRHRPTWCGESRESEGETRVIVPLLLRSVKPRRAADFRNVWKISILGREPAALEHEPEASPSPNFPIPDLLHVFCQRARPTLQPDSGAVRIGQSAERTAGTTGAGITNYTSRPGKAAHREVEDGLGIQEAGSEQRGLHQAQSGVGASGNRDPAAELARGSGGQLQALSQS